MYPVVAAFRSLVKFNESTGKYEWNSGVNPLKIWDKCKTELSNISNVMNQYLDGLNTGTVDPDETLPKLKEALDKAGYDKVLKEMQKQYDEFRQEQ